MSTTVPAHCDASASFTESLIGAIAQVDDAGKQGMRAFLDGKPGKVTKALSGPLGSTYVVSKVTPEYRAVPLGGPLVAHFEQRADGSTDRHFAGTCRATR